MPDLERKSTTGAIKAVGEAGEFEAVIATFDVIDHDGDIVEHGAFSDFDGASIMPAHDQQSVPLGKVHRIEERGQEAVAVGKFNRDVAAGRDWHEALLFDMKTAKENGQSPVQQWSWGYRPKGEDGFRLDTVDDQPVRRLLHIDTEEFSPVLRGASLGTRTLAVKAHKTKTSDAVWDAVANYRKIDADAGMFLPGVDLGYIHHFVNEDNSTGKASTRACMQGIAALNGADPDMIQRLSEDERKTAHDHLAGHLKDAGITPAELRDGPVMVGVKLTDQVRLVIWQAEAAHARLQEVAAKSKGGLSDAAKAAAIEMATAVGDMTRIAVKLAEMVDQLSPEDEVALALAEYMASEVRRSLV